MKTIDTSTLDSRVAHKILAFLNRADAVSDLTDGLLEDDPETGSGGYVIGKTVAERILQKRDELPGEKFTSIKQLAGIPGLGYDKFQDLIFSLSRPDAELFRDVMYLDLLPRNWDLRQYTVPFSNEGEFLHIVEEPWAFQYWLSREVSKLARGRMNVFSARRAAKRMIRRGYVEIFDDPHIASYAMALWLYKFDADNWFNFEDVRRIAEDSLAYYPAPSDRIQLRMVKGFQTGGLLTNQNTVEELPVWINFAEQSITIWTAELRD